MQFIDTNLKTDSVQTLKKDMVKLCYVTVVVYVVFFRFLCKARYTARHGTSVTLVTVYKACLNTAKLKYTNY